MKVKTSELVGAALDWAVDKALNLNTPYHPWGVNPPAYSTNWAHGGPLIEREIHAFDHMQSDRVAAMIKRKDMKNGGWNFGYGPTALIAAMRCYVSAHLGEEVDVLEELI